MKNILEMLEASAQIFPDKTAFVDEHASVNWSQLMAMAKSIGSAISKDYKNAHKPILVCIDKSIACIATMLGIIYSGNMYVVIDIDSPLKRVLSIATTLNTDTIITTKQNTNIFRETTGKILLYEELVVSELNKYVLNEIRSVSVETDPVYALFTSGSTGVPKGAVITHRSIISYSEWFCNAFNICSDTIFGNQTPLYFSMSVSDIYATIRCAANMVLLPKKLFSQPAILLQKMQEYRINTIYWVPTALSLIANWKALDYIFPKDLQTILFAGEVMPVKQLNYWIHKYPDAVFANLFGPTETTDICTYYVIDRAFQNNEKLPIGKACDNCHVFALNDKGQLIRGGEIGELYVRGPFLSSGYYNNLEKTSQVFVQNPLNNVYPEIVYRTGDLVKINQNNELEYVGRVDFQIKRKGYRIELGEIETAACSLNSIRNAVCVYANERIVLFCEATEQEEQTIREEINSSLPQYMLPDVIKCLKKLPINANGKIDRKALMQEGVEHK